MRRFIKLSVNRQALLFAEDLVDVSSEQYDMGDDKAYDVFDEKRRKNWKHKISRRNRCSVDIRKIRVNKLDRNGPDKGEKLRQNWRPYSPKPRIEKPSEKAE